MDIVPKELSEEEDAKKGLTKKSPAFRSKFATMGIKNVLKTRTATFYVPEDAKLITPDSFNDHMHWLGGADWIIKVVMENLETKKGYSKKVEEIRKPRVVGVITGSAIERPRSTTFRIVDIVGLDVFAHVARNVCAT